jgi:pimeloyl-ACP methyl ester carboxylesterase
MRSGTHLHAALGIAAVSMLLAGCGALMSPQQARLQAEDIASVGRLQPREMSAGPFTLLTFARGTSLATPLLHVYIEGDGRAWRGRRQPPRNPTPVDPVALTLAAADPHPAVLYLARPCQFVEAGSACDPSLWTDARYGEAAVAALHAVLQRVQAPVAQRRLLLIGHSGGGVMAALLAARRPDVVALVTLASPLSVSDWTRTLSLSPLTRSLDPATLPAPALARLARLPQHHFLGSDDAIVPASSLRGYLDALPRPHAATLRIIPGIDHHCCWRGRWPALLHRVREGLAPGPRRGAAAATASAVGAALLLQ